jgi:protein-serine/threonine kinase
MQTSCGSPCYAAPELVISEGLYVGSAVDIWSCGVILYAMLAGYLPFDDDPANPDGDNINLLYRYIVNTPLSFPDYISTEARDLLSLMLVPDPIHRTTLDGVMRHPWLSAYHSIRTDGQPNAFGKTVEDLEKAALDQHQQKRQAYQKQMKANVLTNGPVSPSRTQSYHPNHEVVPQSGSRSRSTQPEYLYDSSLDQPMVSPPAAHVNTTPSQNGTTRKTYGSPVALGLSEDDPFAGPENVIANYEAFASNTTNGSKQPGSDETSRGASTLASTAASPTKGHKPNSSGAGGFRHTIQVEYDEPSSKNTRKSDEKRRERSGSQSHSTANGQQNGVVSSISPATMTKERRSSQSSAKPLPPSPIIVPPTSNSQTSYRSPSTTKIPSPNLTPTKQAPTKQTPTKVSRNNDSNGTQLVTGDSLVVNVSSPPQTPRASAQQEKDKDSGSQNSASSTQKGHKKGKSSIDKLGLSKIFSSGFGPTSGNNNEGGAKNLQASTMLAPFEGKGSATSVLLNPVGPEKETGKKSRRNTLTVMVEPFSRSIRSKKARMTNTPRTPSTAVERPKPVVTPPQSQSAVLPQTNGNMDFGDLNGLQVSTSKARKVMQWFRTKSKGRDSVGFVVEEEVVSKEKGIGSKYRRGFSSSNNAVNQTQAAATASQTGFKNNGVVPVVLTSPASALPPQGGYPQRSASSVLEVATPSSLVARFRSSITVGSNSHHVADKMHPNGQLRIHHGAVDKTTITTRPPPEVMAHVKKILEGMGVEIQLESEYKYRCIRAKKKKNAVGSSTVSVSSAGPTPSLAAVTMVGSAASNGVSYFISSMGLFILYPNIFPLD